MIRGGGEKDKMGEIGKNLSLGEGKAEYLGERPVISSNGVEPREV